MTGYRSGTTLYPSNKMSATDFQVFTKEGVVYYRENDQEDWKLLEDEEEEDYEEEEDDEDDPFDTKYPDASCYRCFTKVNSKTVIFCGGGGGACETWYCKECYEEGTYDCCVCMSDMDSR